MKRPIGRRLGLAAAAAVLLALAVLTALRFRGAQELDRAAQRFEAELGPLEVEAYSPEAVPEAENAALPVLEALDRIERSKPDLAQEIGTLRRRNRRPAAFLAAEEWRATRSLLDDARVQPVLGTLHQAAGRDRSNFQLEYGQGIDMEIPNLLVALEAADLLFAEARLAWRDGRIAEGVTAVESLAALSLALETEAPLVFQLVGHGIEIVQYRAIQEALAAGVGEPDLLRDLLATTAERPRRAMLRGPLGAEGAFLYSARPGGPAGSVAVADQPWPERLHHRWLGHRPIAAGLDYFVETAAAFPDLTATELAEGRSAWKSPRGGHHRLVPNLRHTLQIFKAAESVRRIARAALTAATARATSGSLPRELPLAEGPDPFTGRSVEYLPRSDSSATLAVPGAEELWKTVRPGRMGQDEEAPLFTWTLGAPAADTPPQV